MTQRAPPIPIWRLDYMPRWQINSHQFSPITSYTPDIGLQYHDVRERLDCISGKWGQQRCNQSYPVNTFSGKNKEQLHYWDMLVYPH